MRSFSIQCAACRIRMVGWAAAASLVPANVASAASTVASTIGPSAYTRVFQEANGGDQEQTEENDFVFSYDGTDVDGSVSGEETDGDTGDTIQEVSVSVAYNASSSTDDSSGDTELKGIINLLKVDASLTADGETEYKADAESYINLPFTLMDDATDTSLSIGVSTSLLFDTDVIDEGTLTAILYEVGDDDSLSSLWSQDIDLVNDNTQKFTTDPGVDLEADVTYIASMQIFAAASQTLELGDSVTLLSATLNQSDLTVTGQVQALDENDDLSTPSPEPPVIPTPSAALAGLVGMGVLMLRRRG